MKKLIILLLLLPTVQAIQPPEEYPEGKCELAAKEFQSKYGGVLVFAVPYLDNQNIHGKFSGAWLNRVYIKGNNKFYYIDYSNQRIFSSKEEANSFYSNAFKNKFENGRVESKLYIIGEDSVPFPIIWN